MINQFHPAVHNGDAIGEQIASIRSLLLQDGYKSEIFSVFPDDAYKAPVRLFREYAPYASSENVLLLHYSIGYPDTVWEWLRTIPDRKVVVYHNITPPYYFAGVNGAYFLETQRGLDQLLQLRQLAPHAWSDSAFNGLDLEARGWHDVKVLPIIFDRQRYDVHPDLATLKRLNDGNPNVLFVGRCVPNKCWQDVILAFFYLKRCIKPDARLCLVGSDAGMQPYRAYLNALISTLGLSDVIFAGHISQAELAAYYKSASVFLCMSEHEGFCVPLVESMYYGVPAIAYKAAAVPETMGDCGLLILRKDFAAIAELIGLLIDDIPLRDRIVSQQKERVKVFEAEHVRVLLRSYLEQVLASGRGSL